MPHLCECVYTSGVRRVVQGWSVLDDMEGARSPLEMNGVKTKKNISSLLCPPYNTRNILPPSSTLYFTISCFFYILRIFSPYPLPFVRFRALHSRLLHLSSVGPYSARLVLASLAVCDVPRCPQVAPPPHLGVWFVVLGALNSVFVASRCPADYLRRDVRSSRQLCSLSTNAPHSSLINRYVVG
jgi:hypothetical protein